MRTPLWPFQLFWPRISMQAWQRCVTGVALCPSCPQLWVRTFCLSTSLFSISLSLCNSTLRPPLLRPLFLLSVCLRLSLSLHLFFLCLPSTSHQDSSLKETLCCSFSHFHHPLTLKTVVLFLNANTAFFLQCRSGLERTDDDLVKLQLKTCNKYVGAPDTRTFLAGNSPPCLLQWTERVSRPPTHTAYCTNTYFNYYAFRMPLHVLSCCTCRKPHHGLPLQIQQATTNHSFKPRALSGTVSALVTSMKTFARAPTVTNRKAMLAFSKPVLFSFDALYDFAQSSPEFLGEEQEQSTGLSLSLSLSAVGRDVHYYLGPVLSLLWYLCTSVPLYCCTSVRLYFWYLCTSGTSVSLHLSTSVCCTCTMYMDSVLLYSVIMFLTPPSFFRPLSFCSLSFYAVPCTLHSVLCHSCTLYAVLVLTNWPWPSHLLLRQASRHK